MTKILNPWKLIIDRNPSSGARNMAVDEYLFVQVSRTPATFLRFYQWLRPTVSLGYSQDIHKVVDVDFCRKKGIDIVRRITGGKVVLHDREVTYSVASSEPAVFTDTLKGSYRLISRALVRGLEIVGLSARLAEGSPPGYSKGTMPCFAFPARDEIEVGGKKIVGSAQKRTGISFLQHGSILLQRDEDLLSEVSASPSGEGEVGMTSLSDELNHDVDFDQVVAALGQGFSAFFDVVLEPFSLDSAGEDTVAAIQRAKYDLESWTFSQRSALI